MSIAEARKAVVGVCTAITVIGGIILEATGVVPESWARPLTAIVVTAGAVLTYLVPNADKKQAAARTAAARRRRRKAKTAAGLHPHPTPGSGPADPPPPPTS